MKKALSILAASAAFTSAFAGSNPFITEVVANTPGNDEGYESIELQSTANFNYAGYYLLVIEGDSTGAGLVDIVVDLGAQSAGSNGLLVVRDSSTPLVPAPDPASVLFEGLTPAATNLENGSQTYVLGFGTPPLVGTDLDVENDGVLDAGALTGFSVVDAIGVRDPGTGLEVSYGVAAGGVNGFDFPQQSFTPMTLYRVLTTDGSSANGWVGCILLGTIPGPFTTDLTSFAYAGGPSGPTSADAAYYDPGTKNLVWPPAGGNTVSGTVTLSDFGGTVAGRSISVEFVGGSTVSATLDASGNWSVPAPAAGTYDVRIKASHWLSKLVGGVVVTGTGATGVNASLINGDVDGDNEVGPGDFGGLATAFLSVDGDLNWNAEADLDGDGEVGPGDFGILANNFLLSGE